MAKVIEITEKKLDKMSSLVEDMLLAGGELMHCITKMEEEFYGERRGGGYGDRSRYSGMTGNRMDDDYDGDSDDEWREMRDMIGERRRMRNYRR